MELAHFHVLVSAIVLNHPSLSIIPTAQLAKLSFWYIHNERMETLQGHCLLFHLCPVPLLTVPFKVHWCYLRNLFEPPPHMDWPKLLWCASISDARSTYVDAQMSIGLLVLMHGKAYRVNTAAQYTLTCSCAHTFNELIKARLLSVMSL